MATILESTKYELVVPAYIVIVTGVLFALLLLLFIACGIGICFLEKKRKARQENDATDSALLHSKSLNGYSGVIKSSKSVEEVSYADLQRRLDDSFARIKEIEDRIDVKASAEVQTYYGLQDGLEKASSRLDVIEYSVRCKEEQ